MSNEMRMFLLTKQGKEVLERQARRQTLLNDPKAIYQDHFVSVRSDALVVKKYFVPSLLPYEFPWDKIEELTYTPQKNDDKAEVRGKGLDANGRWWATDVLRVHERELHLYNIRIESDTEPRKSGFTVVEIEHFLKACRPLLPYSCRLSGCIWSETPRSFFESE